MAYIFDLPYLRKSPVQFKNLINLWDFLDKEIFPEQEGPLVPFHGKKHIEIVITNLINLLKPITGDKNNLQLFFNRFGKQALCEIFAAAMVHDCYMKKMHGIDASSKEGKNIRDEHTEEIRIKETIYNPLKNIGFSHTEADRIIHIASCHSAVNDIALKRKLLNSEVKSDQVKNHLYFGSILVAFADFLHIGKDRVPEETHYAWTEEQIEHFIKHQLLDITLSTQIKTIYFNLSKIDNKLIENIKIESIKNKIKKKNGRQQILAKIMTEAKFFISELNKFYDLMNGNWILDTQESFGKILPQGEFKWANAFSHYFHETLKTWKINNKLPMPVDMMGHSLYGRFIEDEEGLNKFLKESLSQGELKLRVIIFDPQVEIQQMQEVFEAQLFSDEEKEKKRSILPNLNEYGEVIHGHEGDVRKSLEKIVNWSNFIRKDSSLEVRGTSRIIYMGIVRFGDKMIVNPYSNKGLFSKSTAILFDEEGLAFDDCIEEFNDIWNSTKENRVLYHYYSAEAIKKNNNKINPIQRLLTAKVCEESMVPQLDYERFILNNHQEKLLNIFTHILSGKPYDLPPYEIEIQPSTKCDLNCDFCIGKSFSSKNNNNCKEINLEKLVSLFDGYGKGRIERFRISGLIGDPLSENSREFSINFINKAKEKNREVVVLTNGCGLNDTDVLKGLSHANFVHISLDAGTKETFSEMKGVTYGIFEKIKGGIKNLCNLCKEKKDSAKVGIGYIVTQRNYLEVDAAVRLAEELGVDYIRFKPDIRITKGIAYQTWKSTEKAINKIQRVYMDKNKDACKLDIYLTDMPYMRHKKISIENCWAKYFYSTIGADGHLYPCDHLTINRKEFSFGNVIEDGFEKVWKKSLEKNVYDKCNCELCPPFAYKFNRLVEELFVLMKSYKNWSIVEHFIEDALS